MTIFGGKWLQPIWRPIRSSFGLMYLRTLQNLSVVIIDLDFFSKEVILDLEHFDVIKKVLILWRLEFIFLCRWRKTGELSYSTEFFFEFRDFLVHYGHFYFLFLYHFAGLIFGNQVVFVVMLKLNYPPLQVRNLRLVSLLLSTSLLNCLKWLFLPSLQIFHPSCQIFYLLFSDKPFLGKFLGEFPHLFLL